MPTELLRGLGCIRPMRLMPRELHGAREVRSEVILTRCGSRLASVCPSCSALYVGDASKLLRLGTFDRCDRFLWLTFTLPSYGRVHYVPKEGETEALKSRGRPSRSKIKRCPCGVFHDPDDALRGTPVELGTYDYEAAAVDNFMAGKLLSHTLRRLSRHVLGMNGGSLPSARVMEWQQRLVVHFHLMIRWESDEAPDIERLQEVIAESELSYVYSDRRREPRTVRWGSQLDLTLIDLSTPAGRKHAAQTQGYLPKFLSYSAKALMEGVERVEGDRHDRARHVRHMRVAASRLLEREGITGSRAARQVESFGWNGQPFRVSASWAPGMNMTILRQARKDYVAAKREAVATALQEQAERTGQAYDPYVPFGGVEVEFIPARLATPVTVADVLYQQQFGYSDQDFKNLHRPYMSGLIDTKAALAEGVDVVKQRRVDRADRHRVRARSAVLQAWSRAQDDREEYD